MRDLLNILDALLERENKSLKSQAIDAVRQTDDERLLQRVIDTLQAGNIDERLEQVLSQDADAKKFLNKIAEIALAIKAPIQEKNRFLSQFSKGILDTDRLLDGNAHSFEQLVGPGFNTELFRALSTALVSQGVGPGEVSLAVMSPKVSWSGRAAGGGDIKVGDEAVEVKTTVTSGGRWINARKATMDMAGIEKAMTDAITKSQGQRPETPIPARVGVGMWVNTIRPMINPKLLPAVTKTMADGLFNHTNNKRYQQALMSGSAEDIKDAILEVGFENYKAYSGFDGILLMDMPSGTAQYFRDYDSMRGRIKADAAYVLAPESEGMPKVSLAAGVAPGTGTETPGSVAPAPVDTARDIDAAAQQRAPVTARTRGAQTPKADEKSLGRKRRR